MIAADTRTWVAFLSGSSGEVKLVKECTSLSTLLTALLLFSAAISYCVPVPLLDVPSLSEASDLIIAGEVVETKYGPTTTIDISSRLVQGRYVTCIVNIHDVLKGSVDGHSISLKYFLPDEPIGYESVQMGNRLVFLKKSVSQYSPTSPYYPSLPATAGVHAKTDNVLSGIAIELSAVLQSPTSSYADKQRALFALGTITTARSTDLLKQALSLQDGALRLNAAGLLLQRNELAGLPLAEGVLVHEEGAPANVVHNLDYAISVGVKSKDAVPTLARLVRSANVETRRAAASALGHTGSQTAVEPLVRLLTDSDRKVRHDAVIGLARITGNEEWGPNMDLFQSDEHKYISYWQDWWIRNSR